MGPSQAVCTSCPHIKAGQIDCVVTHRVDRLSRSLLDFARLMEVFEQHHVAFVSVTQHLAVCLSRHASQNRA